MPRKFQVGDKVRVLIDKVPKKEREYVIHGISRYRIGTITEIFDDGDPPYAVVFRNEGERCFDARELELITRKGK